ncbi:hypothetical protein [Enterococcus sp. S86.2]|uniref:hypothetical protein n=1 Tax=Enterococcus sp. S86.2 TaxID=3031299 RepID=UPI0026ED5521|nr:hypothetical protein [Enterococcus sp. S86.2]
MEKVDIQKEKTLKLMKVLIKELDQVDLIDLDHEIQKMLTLIQVAGIKVRGPLITRMKRTHVTSDGKLLIDYDIILQTVSGGEIEGLEYSEVYKVSNCLYAHFDGLSEDFHFSQEKLGLYAWENNILTTGEEYVVHIKNGGEKLIADIFRPII